VIDYSAVSKTTRRKKAVRAGRRRLCSRLRLAAVAGRPRYRESGFVFTDPLGAPLRPFAFTDAFRKVARKAGVRKRLHDARHTAHSYMLADGVDVATAATIMEA
jgi:integrase